MLVTSRRALGIDGEHELALVALELPAADADVAQAAGNAAVALFVDRARAVRADFHFGARNGATLVELVRALDGMPLAIELAASRVRSIAPAELLARLRSPARRASTCWPAPARSARSRRATRRCSGSSNGAGSSSAPTRRACSRH